MIRQTGAVIVPGAAGYWFLGKGTPHGVQLDIENWANLADARRWCSLRGIRPKVVVGESVLGLAEIEQIETLFRDLPPPNIRGMKALIGAGLVVKAGRGKKAQYHLTLAGRTLAQGLPS